MKFYKCKECNKLILDGKCCGDLIELIPNTVDASHEKHIPSIIINNDKIDVVIGEIEHPMTDEHYISHIIQESNDGINIVCLDKEPKASFENKPSIIYAYCNLHGLWKKNI